MPMKGCFYTSHSGLPHNVGVFEARDDVVGDSEGKFDAVPASFLEAEETAFRIVSKWNWQNQIWPARGEYCEA
jgi:hypothetical protein